MDTQPLIAAGLQPLQAKVYASLLGSGRLTPPETATKLGLTRTNAYKILDRLVEMGLAHKVERSNKTAYEPTNPLALSSMVNEARNKVTAQEEAVKLAMNQLLAQYYENTEQPTVMTVTGRENVVNAFFQQIDLRQPIYFIRSQSDIPSMGFETMHEIRVKPAHYDQQRFGITPDVTHGPTNPSGDKRSNLTRTWVKKEDYSAPVEWSVSGSTVLIVMFGNEPHAVTIVNPIIAESFRQIWNIMNGCLQAMPYYKTLPRSEG